MALVIFWSAAVAAAATTAYAAVGAGADAGACVGACTAAEASSIEADSDETMLISAGQNLTPVPIEFWPSPQPRQGNLFTCDRQLPGTVCL